MEADELHAEPHGSRDAMRAAAAQLLCVGPITLAEDDRLGVILDNRGRLRTNRPVLAAPTGVSVARSEVVAVLALQGQLRPSYNQRRNAARQR